MSYIYLHFKYFSYILIISNISLKLSEKSVKWDIYTSENIKFNKIIQKHNTSVIMFHYAHIIT